MNTCPNCEQPIPQDAVFCPSCGTSIRAAQEASDESLVGRVLSQKYRLLEHLAEGGMAVVYKALRIFFDDYCAVKIIKKGLASKDEMLKRFQREAKLTNKVARRSSFIIDIYDFGVEEGVGFYYVMELLNGHPFTEILQDKQHPPPALKMVRYVCQICEALAVVHEEGLVHRDIKPDNIFLHRAENSDTEVVKLLDFGIARPTVSKSTMLTNYGRVMGTPEYMSPEQCRGPTPEQYERGESHLDGRSDIYSLGILLYQGLTGEVPFPMADDGGPMSIHKVMAGHVMEDPTPPLEHRPDLDISPALSAVTLKALAKEPSARFQSMMEFRDALLSCFPALISEFRGVSAVDLNSHHFVSPAEDVTWDSEREPNAGLDLTDTLTPALSVGVETRLDRTALDVQLPDSILEEARRWAEQHGFSSNTSSGYQNDRNPEGGNGFASPHHEQVSVSDQENPWPSHLDQAHTFDPPAGGSYDLGKTVTEPMAPEMMKQLQDRAAAVIRAENKGTSLPFPPRSTPYAHGLGPRSDTQPNPPRLQRKKRNTGSGSKLWLTILLLILLGAGSIGLYLSLISR